jgi:hypothetical protein
MAHHIRLRFFDPVALTELNRALKWQRRYRRLRKLVCKLQGERRGHLRLIDRYEREIAFFEHALMVGQRLAVARRRPNGGDWGTINFN